MGIAYEVEPPVLLSLVIPGFVLFPLYVFVMKLGLALVAVNALEEVFTHQGWEIDAAPWSRSLPEVNQPVLLLTSRRSHIYVAVPDAQQEVDRDHLSASWRNLSGQVFAGAADWPALNTCSGWCGMNKEQLISAWRAAAAGGSSTLPALSIHGPNPLSAA